MATIILPQTHCAAEALTTALTARGHCVLQVPVLYHLPDDSPVWARLAGLPGEVAVLAELHPRALEWLLRYHGVACDGWRLLNLGACPDPVVELALPDAAEGANETLAADTGQRWYPVMDFSRCTNCHHCLQFCLFGVYDAGPDNQVRVVNPDACKAGCPACSRVCPASAIMFPLYGQEPAIAGAPDQFVTRDADARRMFYTRTDQSCPLCAAKGDEELAGITSDGCCPECGRKLEVFATPPSATLDEIDALIARLDDLSGSN